MPASLGELLLSTTLPETTIRARVERIHRALLSDSRFVRQANFKAIHPDDLEFLFMAYDRDFFDGQLRAALDGKALDFRLSGRMTKAGGATAIFRNRVTGRVSYEITIASSLLFEGFGDGDRRVTVCGLECATRLEALQRIFEHELVHLGEKLSFGDSSCSAPRFQRIAARWFLHSAHTHALITRSDRAAESGIQVGSPVSFVFEGRRLSGRVNRITKRASVLVPDPEGRLFKDGGRYLIYYVPIGALETAAASAAGKGTQKGAIF